VAIKDYYDALEQRERDYSWGVGSNEQIDAVGQRLDEIHFLLDQIYQHEMRRQKISSRKKQVVAGLSLEKSVLSFQEHMASPSST